jgi:hypothetical protein
VLQTGRGLREASAVSEERGLPSSRLIHEIADSLDHALPPGAPVMSNLGPTLAWYTRRPVIHLALTPADIDLCRQRLEFADVVLAFRESSRAWPGWNELMARPLEATTHSEWNIARVRSWGVREGFNVVWIELAPTRAPLARR